MKIEQIALELSAELKREVEVKETQKNNPYIRMGYFQEIPTRLVKKYNLKEEEIVRHGKSNYTYTL